MAPPYNKIQVRSMFRYAKKKETETPKTKFNELIHELFNIVTDTKYCGGEIHRILHGGIEDISFTQHPTGIINIPPLHVVSRKYPEIDWSLFFKCETIPGRFRYISYVFMNEKFINTEISTTVNSTLHLLHINSYLRIPLYTASPTRNVIASINHSYGFPCIYSAELFLDGEKWKLSECSIDIMNDRKNNDQIYNRGYVFNLPDLSQVFYFDRRANVKFQNEFIKYLFSNRFHDKKNKYLPNENLIKYHVSNLKKAVKILKDETINVEDTLQKYIGLCKSLEYSILGFNLFEIIHEFISESIPEINKTHTLLMSIDPSLKKRWTTRGFCPSSMNDLERVLNSIKPAKGEVNSTFKDFCHFFKEQAPIRFDAYQIGATANAALAFFECAFNSLFYKQFYDNDLDSSRYTSEEQIDLKDIEDFLGAEMSSHLIKIMITNDVGAVCIPFQPDPRGEFLITPLINHCKNLRIDRFRIDISSGQYTFHKEEEIEAKVLVSSFNKYNPIFYLNKYIAENETLSEKYNGIFKKICSRIDLQWPVYSERIGSSKALAVVIPFFKEKSTFIKVAVESCKYIKKMGFLPIVVLTSNQPTYLTNGSASHEMGKSIGLVEKELGVAGIGKNWKDYFIVPIQTEEIAGFSHWMIEKYINIHSGLYFLEKIKRSTSISHVGFLEGDVEEVDKWWEILKSIGINDKDVVIFEFEVGVRDEGANSKPVCDVHSSDAVLGRYIAESLFKSVAGVQVRNLFGGNYLLSIEAASMFKSILDNSAHNESLIESNLLDLNSAFNFHIVNVGRKIHLPAVEGFYFSTDEKFINWTMDLMHSLQRYESLKSKSFTNHSNLEPMLLKCDSQSAIIERISKAIFNFEYCKQIYSKVLSVGNFKQWENIVDTLKVVIKDPKPEIEEINNDFWNETLFQFYKYIKGRETREIEEVLFSLKILFTFLISSHGYEKVKNIGVA